MAKTILLADDSTTIRKVVELTFCDTEIRVETVASGRDALERLETLRPDLVLADIGMDEPSGYEICRRVKNSERPVPVVLLAGTFEPFDETRAASCGADGHVIKPFESAALVRQVQTLLGAAERAELEAAAEAERQAAEELQRQQDPVEQALDEVGREAPELVAPTPGDGDATALELHESELKSSAAGQVTRLAPEDLDALTRAVAERLTGDALRELAWEVVPQLAETIIRERIRQLEREIED